MDLISSLYFLTPVWFILLLLTKPNKLIVLSLPGCGLGIIFVLLLFGKFKRAEEISVILFFLLLFSLVYLLFYEKN